MILSMTGFAALAAELPGCSMSVELRSVNHRYLDIQLRLPDELRNGVEVLYTAPDPSDIARNLSILLGDTELRTELAENAFLRVREAFGPVRVARKLQEVYRTATGAKEP